MLALEYDEDVAKRVEREDGIKVGEIKGIKTLIETLKDMDVPDEIILQKLQKNYHLTEEEATEYIDQYSK